MPYAHSRILIDALLLGMAATTSCAQGQTPVAPAHPHTANALVAQQPPHPAPPTAVDPLPYDRTSHIGTLNKGLAAAANGWTVVDMKNDWKRVFSFEWPLPPAEK